MRYRWNSPAGGARRETVEPLIRVKTGASPWNGKIYVRLAGFVPGRLITLKVRVVSGGLPPEELWRARAVFRADGYGMVDVGLQEPVASSPGYAADPLGLFGLKHCSGSGRGVPEMPAGYTVELSAAVQGRVVATAALWRPPQPEALP